MDTVNLVREWCRSMAHQLNELMVNILAILRYYLGWPIPPDLLTCVSARYRGFRINRYHEWSWFNVIEDVPKIQHILQRVFATRPMQYETKEDSLHPASTQVLELI